MTNAMTYKGYFARIDFDGRDNIFVGHVLGVDDKISFHGSTVGELTDEHDPTAPALEDLGDGVFRVPARLGRDELGELFGLEVDDEDVDTAGGLLTKALGKVPLPGSSGEIHGLHLVADRVEGRRRRLATVLVNRVDRDGVQDQAPAVRP